MPQMAGHKPSQLCSAPAGSENWLQSGSPEIFDVSFKCYELFYLQNCDEGPSFF